MKIIDLKDRTIFVDDIIQIYIERNYNPEKYNIQTTNGNYIVSKEDYIKVKDYLLSLNDKVEIIEDKKIETINNFISNVGAVDENNIEEYIHKLFEQEFILFSKINEIIDIVNKLKDDRK